MTSASGPPSSRRYGHPLTLVAVAAVALVAGAGAAAIATSGGSPGPAADSTSAKAGPSPSASASPWPGPRRPSAPAPGRAGGFFGGGIGGGFPGAPVHGTLVVPVSGGGYQTEDVQRGKVTAISSSSVTVVSADKFKKTYRVTGSTSVNAGNGGLSGVKVGDQVSLTATEHGSSATITSMIDLSRLGGRFPGPGGGNQGQPSG